MSAATKAPPAKLTLRDSTDLMLLVDQWVEDHVDELELNGGALPEDLAAILDEIKAGREERAEAIVWKLDQFAGNSSSAKATKDRAARRQKVWDNATAALKAYALRELEREGGTKIKAPSATLRIQSNSSPTVDVRFDNEQMLTFIDAGAHPLAKYLVVARVVSIDKKALGAAYEARRAELIDESQQYDTLIHPDEPGYEEAWKEVLELRTHHVEQALATEFPGVSCVRGHHLRID
jgi:hypothetical protein